MTDGLIEENEAFPDTVGSTPDWFKSAVFYEVLVRSFRDSNGDGTGDFKGLTEKLDYLQWLGVDCLWVPPFFSSPLRDGGYDVSDYTNILPECGSVEDFHDFLDEAHKRDIRVIIDFVMNHTSDQHPWFQASREDPDGPYGDFYVWSDTDDLYQDARVIFVDTEPSNWTWDPVRQQYFWHRFFSHQPDLNFDNPKVHEAMLEAISFWFDMGLDGFRLDAVPYLYERPGTNGENLPETHEFLRMVRTYVDEHYPGRVLLAEANQWPADVVDYFGDFEKGGDECHMCFHFPVMPRIFMAVRRESRFPISEILEQTPPIPSGTQWGIFLRNHDELTLEMVSDEDRDYMWGEYAKDPRMKANIGIRRRLAPLLDNDINQIELFNALLLSLPGSPVLYYGDEIGMGDNIWLGDRDGVRTPMQWTPDRNAGFSSATPGKLHLPVIQDPVYGYQSVNVEAQLENSSSLLHWTRRMIQARRQHDAFGLGSFTDLGGSNPTVLSYVREHVQDDGRHDVILCVNNLSRFPQPVELDLRRWEGMVPLELLGGVPFPAVGELPYLLTLGGYGFYWFRMIQPDTDEGMRAVIAPRESPRLRTSGGRAGSAARAGPSRSPAGAGSARSPATSRAARGWRSTWRRCPTTTAGRTSTTRSRSPSTPSRRIASSTPWWACGTTRTSAPPTCTTPCTTGRRWPAGCARSSTRRRARWRSTACPGTSSTSRSHSTLFSGEQSNSSVAFGDDSLLKVFRKITPGVNPDVAIHRVLTEAGSDHVAALYGWVETPSVNSEGEPTDAVLQLAMLQQFLRTASDGWDLALASVRNLFAEADLHADEVGGDFAGEAARLGEALAETHQTLAEHFPVAERSADEVGELADAMRTRLDAALDIVPGLAPYAENLRRAYDDLAALGGVRVQQIHGDLHLGQTLRTVRGWKIVDFEGEPAKPLAERLLPDSPWRDVAGMLRSFDYAPRVVERTWGDEHRRRAPSSGPTAPASGRSATAPPS